ncbi:predicted protein [Pyrenophora tritici-repentis Pt-1C-BFP]|uniref:Uncharacterized protein n=1 Tax=Pyrenophora tritici-repentis (strain Pt-1C-BFP) TaxID=426418 RepID=B2VS86_PYRTR|nr:uncharacterized protein PTRG_01712 [Pyrenophora tritici-repentis Pt-1C-BFP]EDU41150.1 predicted protein [Pyrenophora tritici-repentis Pt-1C-BFP]
MPTPSPAPPLPTHTTMQPNAPKPHHNRLLRTVYEPYLSKFSYAIHVYLSAVVVMLCTDSVLPYQPIIFFLYAILIGAGIYKTKDALSRVQIRTSIRAVHFTLCFYTLSTLQQYTTHGITGTFLPGGKLPNAASGPTGYWTYTPYLLLDKDQIPKMSRLRYRFSLAHSAHTFQVVVFHTVTGLLNHAVRRLVNPAAVYPDSSAKLCWPAQCVDVNWFDDLMLVAPGMNTYLFDE